MAKNLGNSNGLPKHKNRPEVAEQNFKRKVKPKKAYNKLVMTVFGWFPKKSEIKNRVS